VNKVHEVRLTAHNILQLLPEKNFMVMNSNISLISFSPDKALPAIINEELQDLALTSNDFTDLAGEELIKQLQLLIISQRPDLVIFIEDFDGQSLYPMEFLRDSFVKRIKTLIIGPNEDFANIYSCLKSRCNGFLCRQQVKKFIREAVQNIVSNDFFMDPKLFSQVIREFQEENNASKTVSEEEKRILKLLAKGLGDAEIADTMGFPRAEVKKTIEKINDKFQLHSCTETVLFAIREMHLHH